MPLPEAGRAGPLDPAVAVGLLQRAQTLTEQGEWQLAANTFSRVVGNNDPNLHVAALLGLAECRYRMDDEAGAVQAWISATQAPEGPLSWRAWKQLAAARVRSGDLTGAARAYREADRRAPSNERAEIQSRLGWLAKETGDPRAAGRHFARSRQGGMPQASMTRAILAVTIAFGLSSLLFAQGQTWTDWLALTKSGVAAGELWRLLTVTLVHAGIIHLAFNMYALYVIGPTVEALYGPWRFLFLYLACGAAASTASYVFSAAEVSVGASGAIFGMFGVLLVADRVHKPALTRHARGLTTQIGVLIAINVVIGFSLPGIDNAAHIGGLLAGCWLGLTFVPRGATSLSSYWSTDVSGQGPGQGLGTQLPSAPSPGVPSPGAQGSSPRRPPMSERRLATLGVLGLAVVILWGLSTGPLRLGL